MTSISRIGPTPAGGVRSVAHFHEDGEVEIEEFDQFDRLLARTYGTTKPGNEPDNSAMSDVGASDAHKAGSWDVVIMDGQGEIRPITELADLASLSGWPADPLERARRLAAFTMLPVWDAAPRSLKDEAYAFLREQLSPRGLAAAETAAPAPPADIEEKRKRADDLVRRWEQVLEDTLERFYARQLEITLARLQGPKARKGTRHWRPAPPMTEAKRLSEDTVISLVQWQSKIEPDVTEIVTQITRASASQVAGDVGGSIDNDALGKIVKSRVGRILESVKTRAEHVREVIRKADDDGKGMADIVALVRDAFAKRSSWARVTARTETAGTINEAAMTTAELIGVTVKIWLSSRDDRVRPTHSVADSQRRSLGKPFQVGGFPMRFPGDPAGPPQEVIGCRCSLLFDRSDR